VLDFINIAVLTMTSKVMSLRLPEKLAADLAAVARADEIPISEAIREAIEHHITARRADKGFKERLKKRVEEDREVLERLAE
jgi:predicted DNA-binding protein